MMDDAAATIERRRDQNREAQRRFRERKKQNQTQNQSQNQNQQTPNHSNDVARTQLPETTSVSRLSVEQQQQQQQIPTTTTAAMHDGVLAFDFPAAAAAFNSMAMPMMWQGDNNGMTALANAMDSTRSISGTSSPKIPRSMSSGSMSSGSITAPSIDLGRLSNSSDSVGLHPLLTCTKSSSTTSPLSAIDISRLSKSSDSIGIHPLLTCSQSQSATTTPMSSMDLDFCPTPNSSVTDGSIAEISGIDKAKFATALHIAARKGNINIVRILLHHGVSCNEQDHENLTPLMHAIIEGHDEVARGLLLSGATVNAETSRPQSSALHLAVAYRREDLLRTLLLHCVEKKISIDPYNERGRTPLHEAIEMDYESAVLMLLHFGADPQCKIRSAERHGFVDFE